jgi:hypothetical protein
VKKSPNAYPKFFLPKIRHFLNLGKIAQKCGLLSQFKINMRKENNHLMGQKYGSLPTGIMARAFVTPLPGLQVS